MRISGEHTLLGVSWNFFFYNKLFDPIPIKQVSQRILKVGI